MTSTETHPYSGLEQPDTNNATWFNPTEKGTNQSWNEDDWWDSDSAYRFQKKERWWVHLEQLNQGNRNGTWTNDPYWTYRDNFDLIENIADEIGTTTTQARSAKRQYFRLHNNHITGIRKDATAVAVVLYTITSDDKDSRNLHPLCENDTHQTVAETLGDQFKLTPSLITSTYGKVQHHQDKTDSDSPLSDFDSENMDRRGFYEAPNEIESETLPRGQGGGRGI